RGCPSSSRSATNTSSSSAPGSRRQTINSTPRWRRPCRSRLRADDHAKSYDGGEALIGFVGPHGDTFEFLELAEEIFDQVAPLVEFRVERQGHRAARMLRDHDLGAPLIEIANDRIAVEGLVSDQAAESQTVDQWSGPDRIETMAGQQDEA